MAVTDAGLDGVVATWSQICLSDGDAGILSYQGFNIHTLAEKAKFEEVIFLLWHGRLPKQAELDELKAALVAARVIAATLSDIHSAVTGGIGALKGPLHGGANENAIKMLLDAGSAEKAIE